MRKTMLIAVVSTVTGFLLTAALLASAQQGDPNLKVNGSPVLTVAASGSAPLPAGTFAGFVQAAGDFGGQIGADALCNGSFGGSKAVLEPLRVANAAHPLEASGMFTAITTAGNTYVWVSEDIPAYPFTALNQLINTIHTTSSCLDFTTAASNERATVILFVPNAAQNNRVQMSPSFKSCDDTSTVLACFTPAP